jgi:hypothetical protein
MGESVERKLGNVGIAGRKSGEFFEPRQPRLHPPLLLPGHPQEDDWGVAVEVRVSR